MSFCRPEVFPVTQWHIYNKSPPPKRLGIFSPNFTLLLQVPIYAGLKIFIQLPATLVNLCHIKREHHYMLKMYHCPKHTLGGRT